MTTGVMQLPPGGQEMAARVLARARKGIYSPDSVKGLDPVRRQRFFDEKSECLI